MSIIIENLIELPFGVRASEIKDYIACELNIKTYHEHESSSYPLGYYYKARQFFGSIKLFITQSDDVPESNIKSNIIYIAFIIHIDDLSQAIAIAINDKISSIIGKKYRI